jgi:hypothetical protein
MDGSLELVFWADRFASEKHLQEQFYKAKEAA